jgi:S1-C subfamily serine protease
MRLRKAFIPAVLGAALLASACAPTTSNSATPANLPTLNTDALSGKLDPSKDPIVQVVENVRPAVVNVTTRGVTQSQFGGVSEGGGTGTGFIIRSDGIIVTNYHVVEGAQRIDVITPEPHSQSYQGRVIGGDVNADLAILKIDGHNLPTVPLGNTSDLQLGQRVVAIGYALALEGGPTVTTGIVSALDRVVEVGDPNCQECKVAQDTGVPTRTYNHVIQTDAAINPGNSGGPLVNLAGQVVGINSAGAGASSADNIGFAIGIDGAKSTIENAVAHPEEATAYVGVVTQPVSKSLAFQFNLPVDHGIYVVDTAKNGPAEKAGIQSGDVIVGFDGHDVQDSVQFGNLITDHKPGDSVDVDVVHSDGSQETVSVTLGGNPLP